MGSSGMLYVGQEVEETEEDCACGVKCQRVCSYVVLCGCNQ